MSMRPTDCDKCGPVFLGDPFLQAEVRHTLLIWGEQAARSKADEVLGKYHDGHSNHPVSAKEEE